MAKERKNTPVRIDDEAIKWARIASGYTGESMADYISRVITLQGKADAERLHAETMGQAAPSTPKARAKGKAEG